MQKQQFNIKDAYDFGSLADECEVLILTDSEINRLLTSSDSHVWKKTIKTSRQTNPPQKISPSSVSSPIQIPTTPKKSIRHFAIFQLTPPTLQLPLRTKSPKKKTTTIFDMEL